MHEADLSQEKNQEGRREKEAVGHQRKLKRLFREVGGHHRKLVLLEVG